jgi:acetylglutamate kinase
MKWLKNFYYKKFQKQYFVIKIGGEILQSDKALKTLLEDIKEIQSHKVKVILVHGGGPQADQLSEKLGHTPTKINGRRVTGDKDLEIVKMLFGGTINTDIIAMAKSLDMKAIRVSGLDGGLLDVKKRPPVNGVDYGHVGDIIDVDPDILHTVLQAGYLPIVSPLAVTSRGNIVNINADTIAFAVAEKLQAEKLILATNVDGVLNDGKLISVLRTGEIEELIHTEDVTGGMIVKLHNCEHAVESGVKRVHIINGLSPHSLVSEVLTKEGVGTMIVSDVEYEAYASE